MSSRLQNFSKEDLQDALNQAESNRSLLRILGYSSSATRMVPLVFKRVEHLGLSIKQFESNKQTRCRNYGRRSDEDVFTKNSTYDRSKIKKRVIKQKLIKYKCGECGNPGVHNGKELTLQLDHINGVHNDHRLINLQFLCPNCHSQTDTYSGRNNKTEVKEKPICPECNTNTMSEGAKTSCRPCFLKNNPSKKIKASAEEIITKIKELNWVQAGKYFGVSDNSLRKKLAREGFCLKSLSKK
jgi:5-methylcytosine-specific restriction endonuclease McrA